MTAVCTPEPWSQATRHGTCPYPALVLPRIEFSALLAAVLVVSGVVGVPSLCPCRRSAHRSALVRTGRSPERAAIERRVIALSGPSVAVEADASITEDAGRLRLVLHVKNGNAVGERVLEGDSCVELAESAAVLLAMSEQQVPPRPRHRSLLTPRPLQPDPTSVRRSFRWPLPPAPPRRRATHGSA